MLIGHYTTSPVVRSQVDFSGYAEDAVTLAVDLVNTFNAHREVEHLRDTGALEAFLRDHRRVHAGRLTRQDVADVRALRARLRVAFEAAEETTAAGIINELLTESRARPQLTDHDGSEWHLHYTASDVPLAQELGAVTAVGLAVVMGDGRWERVHVCEGDRCRDVFVDMSRNRSRRFCSPEVCGNRASVGAYRRRAKASGAPG